MIRRRELIQAAAAAPLAACAAAEGPLRFWAMGREGEVVVELLEGFRREHPGIEVQVEQLPWSAAHEKLLTAFAGNSTPDIAQLGNTWIAEFAALQALAPLNDAVAASGTVKETDYFSGIWQTNLVDGRLLGLPWYVDTRLLFYRRDLLAQVGFDRPPADWSEWRQQMQALHAGPVRQPLVDLSPGAYDLLCRGLAQGGVELP